MRPGSILLLASAAAAGAEAAPNVLEIGINKLQPGQQQQRRRGLNRRASTYAENLVNNITGGGYYADVTVGTPPQPLTLVLDTGSSDVWVVAPNADLCTSVRLQNYYGDSCGETYNPNKSSTYKLIEADGFSIQYIDGSGSEGDFISDTFSVGGANLSVLQMGYATQTVRGTGIMGVGFDTGESSESQYPNFMDQLTRLGLVNVKAFSLYLNDRRSASGTILFGGLDTDKFVGPLAVLPIVEDPASGGISSFTVSLQGLSVSWANGTAANVHVPSSTIFSGIGNSSSSGLPAVLDSGTTLSYLPDDVATNVFDAVGAYTDDRETGLTFADCNLLSSSSAPTLHFTFASGTTIAVPAYEMVIDVFDGYESEIPPGIPFSDVCLFGIQSTGAFSSSGGGGGGDGDGGDGEGGSGGGDPTSDLVLLGDSFLRSAYVVYDLANAQVGIAPANLNSSTSSLVEFPSGATGIPAATGVKSQQQTATGAPTGTGTHTNSANPTATTTDSTGGGSTGTGTASPGAKNAAPGRPARDPGSGVFAVMAVSGLFALLGGFLML